MQIDYFQSKKHFSSKILLPKKQVGGTKSADCNVFEKKILKQGKWYSLKKIYTFTFFSAFLAVVSIVGLENVKSCRNQTFIAEIAEELGIIKFGKTCRKIRKTGKLYSIPRQLIWFFLAIESRIKVLKQDITSLEVFKIELKRSSSMALVKTSAEQQLGEFFWKMQLIKLVSFDAAARALITVTLTWKNF